MLSKPLKYSDYAIVFQEVPGELTLAINVTGCPHKCDGCHSAYMLDYHGNFIHDDLDKMIQKYDGLISCVCFMGGDQNMSELCSLSKKIQSTYGLKTAVYSGSNDRKIFMELIPCFDYVKFGSYKKELGGLDSPITNQVFYQIHWNEKRHTYDLTDIGYKFRKKNDVKCE